MGNKCIRCGDCCEFLALGDLQGHPDREFILAHCRPTEAPKKKPNPLMSDKCFDGYIWYKCVWFDAVNRRCKAYEYRPAMCKEYPNKRKPESLISARCGFFNGEK